MQSSSNNPLAAEPPPERLGALLAICAGYFALALLWTWPLALQLGTGAIQRGSLPVDAGQGVWNLWWARTALLQGANPYQTQLLFFPLEVDLFYQTLSLPNALLAAPALLWSPVLAFNLLALSSFSLGGLFAYRLARAVVPGRAAALLAGFAYAFTPYHLQRLWGGSLELIAVQWIPLYILLLMAALRRRTVGHALGAGLALLLVTLASQYYGLYCVIYTLPHVALALLLTPGWAQRLRGLATAAGIGAVWLVGLLPFIWPLSELGGAAIEDWYERQVYHSAALVDFVLPHALHPWWGGVATGWQNAAHPFGLETGAAMGLAVYALCGVALARRWRQSWPWLVLALGMALLALGPELKIGGGSTGLPLPFLLLDGLGPFRNSSRPSVFLALAMLPVAVLVGLGASALGLQGAGRWGRRLPLIVAACGLVLEALVAPWPIVPLRPNRAYASLASDAVPGAVLELPPRNNDSQYLLNQICHGRPLVGGYLARLPGYPLLEGESALARLWQARAPTDDILPLDAGAELASLGVRYVSLDLTQLSRAQIERLRATLAAPGVKAVASPDGLSWYRVAPGANGLAAALGAGWLALEQAGERRWRWMGDEAAFTLLATQAGPATLSFSATAYGSERVLEIWQDATQVFRATIAAAPYDQQVTISLLLPAGQSSLLLRAPAEAAPDGRQLSLSIGSVRVAALPTAPGFTPARQPLPAPLPSALRFCS